MTPIDRLLRVMETLTQVASHGRVVIAAVHQPRSSIFQLFHSLVLLKVFAIWRVVGVTVPRPRVDKGKGEEKDANTHGYTK